MPQPESPDESEQGPNIVMPPEEFAGKWANAAAIARTPHEFTLDFLRIGPQGQQGIVVSRVSFRRCWPASCWSFWANSGARTLRSRESPPKVSAMTEEEPLERAGDMKPTKVPLKGPNVISTVNMPPPVDAVEDAGGRDSQAPSGSPLRGAPAGGLARERQLGELGGRAVLAHAHHRARLGLPAHEREGDRAEPR